MYFNSNYRWTCHSRSFGHKKSNRKTRTRRRWIERATKPWKLAALVEGQTSTEVPRQPGDSRKTAEVVAVRRRGGTSEERGQNVVQEQDESQEKEKDNPGRFSCRNESITKYKDHWIEVISIFRNIIINLSYFIRLPFFYILMYDSCVFVVVLVFVYKLHEILIIF